MGEETKLRALESLLHELSLKFPYSHLLSSQALSLSSSTVLGLRPPGPTQCYHVEDSVVHRAEGWVLA